MKIASIVRPLKGKDPLRSGGEWWPFAIVCSLEPFIMVSVDTEMRWSHRQPEDFEVIGVAAPHIFNGCQHRLEPKDQRFILERPQGGIGPELLPEGFEWTRSLTRTQLICVSRDAMGNHSKLWGWVFEKEGDFWCAKYQVEAPVAEGHPVG